MSWAGAKAAIVTALEGLSITSPQMSIKRVYANPPGTVQDWPSFIISPPGMHNTLGGSFRQRTYRVPILMVASDQDMAQAAAICDAFREVFVTAFDSNVGLSGHATQCYAEDIDPAGGYFIPPIAGGKLFQGFQAYLHLEVKETVAFS